MHVARILRQMEKVCSCMNKIVSSNWKNISESAAHSGNDKLVYC